MRRFVWHPVVYAVNLLLLPYNVARDFDSPPKPRWMKWISIERQIFMEPDLKEHQR